jgi:hypothetical protein
MTPPTTLRTNSDGTIPMGPLQTISPAERTRALSLGTLHDRRTPSFLPPQPTLSGVTSGTAGRAPSHSSRPAGRASSDGSAPHPVSGGLVMSTSVHSGRGPQVALVESHREGPALPHGPARGPTTPRARVETLLGRAHDHYNAGTIDSRLSSSDSLTRAHTEFDASRRDLHAAWQVIRSHPSLARDPELMSEYRSLRSQLTRASTELESREVSADLARSLADPIV